MCRLLTCSGARRRRWDPKSEKKGAGAEAAERAAEVLSLLSSWGPMGEEIWLGMGIQNSMETPSSAECAGGRKPRGATPCRRRSSVLFRSRFQPRSPTTERRPRGV